MWANTQPMGIEECIMMTDNDLLKQGIAALNAGRKAEARKLLMQVVKQDKHNEMAWLWLSGAVDAKDDRRTCLENVLTINPNNTIARRGLALLNARTDTRPLSTASSLATDAETSKGKPATQPVAGTREAMKFASQAKAKRTDSGWKWLFVGGGGAAILLLTGFFVAYTVGIIRLPSITGLTGVQEWEYKSETVPYDTICATMAVEPYNNTDAVRLAVQMGGYSYLTIVNLWQMDRCYGPTLPEAALEEILATYATCADDLIDSHMAEMGSQGWEMVSHEQLEHIVPGSGLCPGITVDYGLEVMWRRPE
jgi:hypothetical protein